MIAFRDLSGRRQAATTAALFLFIATAVLIFLFSAEPAADSSSTSHGFTERVLSFINPRFRAMSDAEQETLIADVHGAVRKLGHFSEFAALGFCSGLFGVCRKIPRPLCVGFAFGVLYACSDEFHQIFVPGRAGRVTDVLIDASGVLFGLLIFWLVLSLCRPARFRKCSIPPRTAG